MAEVKRDGLDRLQVIATLLTPLLIAALGAAIQFSERDAPKKAIMLQQALEILQTQPDSGQIGLREWAIEVLERESGYKFDSTTKRQLVASLYLPGGNPYFSWRFKRDSLSELYKYLGSAKNDSWIRPRDSML